MSKSRYWETGSFKSYLSPQDIIQYLLYCNNIWDRLSVPVSESAQTVPQTTMLVQE